MNNYPPTSGVSEHCHLPTCEGIIGEYEPRAFLGILGPYHLRCAPAGIGRLFQPDTALDQEVEDIILEAAEKYD